MIDRFAIVVSTRFFFNTIEILNVTFPLSTKDIINDD